MFFPHHPEGPKWFFQQVRNYIGGLVRYIVHAMQVLMNKCIHKKLYNLTESEMYAKIEGTPPYINELATLSNMKPNSLRVFYALLLAAAAGCEFQVSEKVYGELVPGESSQYVLHISNKFGFYYEYYSKKGPEQVQINEQRVKLVFPKMFLKIVKKRYRYYPRLTEAMVFRPSFS